jgi:hypothetical protein
MPVFYANFYNIHGIVCEKKIDGAHQCIVELVSHLDLYEHIYNTIFDEL